MRTLVRELDNFNGQGIRSVETARPIKMILGVDVKAKNTEFYQPRNKIRAVVAGDASESATCAYSVSGPGFYARAALPAAYIGASSGHRELCTVKQTLESHGHLLRGDGVPQTILWLTDSTNLTAFLEKGSTIPAIQADALAVFKKARSLNIVLLPVHLFRQDPRIVIADAGSKWRDSDDWKIDILTFREIQRRFGRAFQVDLFADCNNTQVGQFFSRYVCPRMQGVDAFARNWNGLCVWACPPTTRIVDTVRKILATGNIRGVLLVPIWTSATFWPFICPDGVHVANCFVKVELYNPYLIQGDGHSEGSFTLMQGRTNFLFAALTIRSFGPRVLAPGTVAFPYGMGPSM